MCGRHDDLIQGLEHGSVDMKFKSIILFVVMTTIFGCSFTPVEVVYRKYDATAKVGIVNLIDERFLHFHDGATDLTDFYKVYPVDWRLWDDMSKVFLEYSSAEVIEVEAPDWISKKRSNIYKSQVDMAEISGKYEEKLAALCQQNGIDVAILVRTQFTSVRPSRFGLYTRRELNAEVRGYAHLYDVHVDAIDCNPIGRNKSFRDKLFYSIPGFRLTENPKQVPAGEIAKLHPVLRFAASMLSFKTLIALGIADEAAVAEYEAAKQRLEVDDRPLIFY